MKTLRALVEWIGMILLITTGLALTAYFLAPVDAAMRPQQIFRTTT